MTVLQIRTVQLNPVEVRLWRSIRKGGVTDVPTLVFSRLQYYREPRQPTARADVARMIVKLIVKVTYT